MTTGTPLEPVQLKKRQMSMLILWISGIAASFVSTLLGGEGTPSTIISIADMSVSVVCIALWCKFDAAARHAKFTSSDITWIVILGLIGVPRYFLRTRRGKQLLFTLFGLYLYIYSIFSSLVGAVLGGIVLVLSGSEVN